MSAIAKLSHQLVELYERLSSWEQDVVKSSGLSPAQMHTIEIVGHGAEGAHGAPLRMKELAKKWVTTGTLTVIHDLRQGAQRTPTKRPPLHLIALTEKGQNFFRTPPVPPAVHRRDHRHSLRRGTSAIQHGAGKDHQPDVKIVISSTQASAVVVSRDSVWLSAELMLY
jgi:hypothetical protein